MYDIKALYEASSVQEAIELLTAHPEAKIIAGGSDVLIKIREGRMAGCELVSIYGIDELRGLEKTHFRKAEFALPNKFSQSFPERQHRPSSCHGDHGVRFLPEQGPDGLRGTIIDGRSVRYKRFHASLTSFP